jgi:poly-beta-1,6-N-acetyl-D-glucosamine synthase
MSEFPGIVAHFVNNALLAVTVIIFTTYLFLTVYSAFALRKYLRKNSYVDYNSIISSPLVPSISVIVPAYNESASIVDNIRTLLSLYYSSFEIVIVNDGSDDDSMQKVIQAYELEKVNYYYDYRLPCEKIKAVYKSRNRSYKKLLVVDKQNGGKADALNAGLNVVRNELIVCIDADSIMEQDALIKLVKPFLEEKDEKMIGAGGVIRIANSCEITDGKITKINLPKKWLPRAQVMEYTRAFLMGRIAWSELDGLLLISGALGMFNREIVIEAGGYSTNTVGEDMELVVRMRRYMVEKDIPYRVEYIPDPLCWTEVPSTIKSLALQRSRWTRGTMETLWTHRKLFLNRKYGKLGLLGYPYWLFFEWLAPILEFVGIIIFAFLAITGRLNTSFFFLLLGFVYFFAVSLSIWSVLFEEITFHKYQNRMDVLRLMSIAFLEPLFYHPLILLTSIKGNIDKLLNNTSWGKQEREGFSNGAEKSKFGKARKAKARTRNILIGVSGAVLASLAIICLIMTGKLGGHEEQAPQDTGRMDSTELVVHAMPADTIEIVPAPVPVPAPAPAPVSTRVQKEYHIIVGSYVYKARGYADRMVEEFKEEGYDPGLHSIGDSLVRVSLYSTTNRREALDSLELLRAEPGLDKAWIWVEK